MRGARRWLRLLAGLLVLIGLGAVIAEPRVAVAALQLPVLAIFSTVRMVVAFLLALVFAISYGYAAATRQKAAVFLLPLLDILQSIPILGFFPPTLIFVDTTFHRHPLGIELAVVFLIFTSMAWNMAFGVYESLTTIPQDLEAAAAAFGVRGWLRFRHLAFPAAIPKLVYNSVLSWTNGWFFLVASEIFTAGGTTFQRPGLGAYIANAGQTGDTAAIAAGIAALAVVVLALDIFLWRPLSVWSERFRMEVASGREVPRVPGPYERFRWIPRLPRARRQAALWVRPVVARYARVSARLERTYTAHPKVLREIRRIDYFLFLVVFTIVVSTGLVGLGGMFLRPLPSSANLLPTAAALSFVRLLAAYVIALAWTIPIAVFLGESERASRILAPVLEVFASLPATALLPVIVGFAILVAGSFEAAGLAAILIALFSMQWYLLFNLIAGVRAIPADLKDAARSFGVRGLTYWKRVRIPAIMPSLLTGSITAWGAGWNAVIVSEYILYAGKPYEVLGLGSLLNHATFPFPNNDLLILTILTMIVVVLSMNKLLWRPLSKRASRRYRLEV
ncbi:MAG TPA: ABC transporter permease subunit [Thermoplasmata archaeon]|jgi:NitT/TauT family transport system permease protein|nr:ABC transporter permease subunit [Thermoplasmata archaeon]